MKETRFVRRANRASFNDIRSLPIPQNSTSSFREPLGTRMIYAAAYKEGTEIILTLRRPAQYIMLVKQVYHIA